MYPQTEESQIGDPRLSRSCGVVKRPDYHCDDDLVLQSELDITLAVVEQFVHACLCACKELARGAGKLIFGVEVALDGEKYQNVVHDLDLDLGEVKVWRSRMLNWPRLGQFSIQNQTV